MTDMTNAQATLFELPPKPSQDCVRNGPCKRCGTTRPPDYPKAMFLEPVSLECLTCNHYTVDELLKAYLELDDQALTLAGRRHLGRPDWLPRKPRKKTT